MFLIYFFDILGQAKLFFFMVHYLQVKVDYLNNTTNTTKITFQLFIQQKYSSA